MTYFEVPAMSNSGLSSILAEVNGNPMPKQSSGFYAFGTEFEDSLLYGVPSDNPKINAMVRESRKHSTFQKLYSDPRIRIQHEWYGTFMDMPFKAKADSVIKGFCVPDIKSTSCPNLEAFRQSIIDYEYDRQMYIYMEIFKCSWACLFGVYKSTKPKIFVVPIERDSYLWNTGREKTLHIVSIVKALNNL